MHVCGGAWEGEAAPGPGAWALRSFFSSSAVSAAAFSSSSCSSRLMSVVPGAVPRHLQEAGVSRPCGSPRAGPPAPHGHPTRTKGLGNKVHKEVMALRAGRSLLKH